MKGEEHLWGVLNDKLDTLRATNHIAEAIRVGQSALEIAKRSFGAGAIRLALSYEKLGLLHEQNGDQPGAKAYLVNAHRLLTRRQPADNEAVFRSSRRLGQLCNELGHTADAISRSFIIRGATTNALPNYIAHRSRPGRKRRTSRPRNTKSWRRTTPISSVRSAKPVKRTHWKIGPVRNDAVDCGCAARADKS